MSTIELRESIIQQLLAVEDYSLLNAFKTFLDSKTKANTPALSDFQEKRIARSRQQVQNGEIVEDDVLQKEVEHWLSTK